MAKREEQIKKKEALEELDDVSQTQPSTKHNVEFSPQKKKKIRKKTRKPKIAVGPTRNQFSRSYVFDSKRDKDKSSVKVRQSKYPEQLKFNFCFQSDITTTTNTTKQRETPSEIKAMSITPAPIYPVNRPNLAATLRFEWSREKLKRYKEAKEMMMRDKFKRPSWGVKSSHAFQQLNYE